MAETWLLLVAAMLNFIGMSWVALSRSVHWQQLRALSDPPVRILRLMASVALGCGLWLCLLADHASIAVLAWVMLLTGSAFSITMVLAWRPRLLAPVVAWLPG